MKIGLIDPGPKKTMLENIPHLGLAYIAAILENGGYETRILDISVAKERGFQRFLDEGFDFIGISATSFTVSKAMKMAREIKAMYHNIIIVLGGPHVSVEMEATLDSPYIDYAIYGEGERTMLELIELLTRSSRPNFEEVSAIKGLIFRDGNKNKTIANAKRPWNDELDDLPFPAFHLFDMNQYGFYPLVTSRGCPFGCSFCASKAIWGTPWRYRSPENIVKEIEYALQRFHWRKRLFSIIDDTFNVDPDRVVHFCNLIAERGIKIQWFPWGIRADRVPLGMAFKMKESGCIAASVGIESANDGVLKKMGKKETLDEMMRGCQNLARVGIPINAQFMIGNIGDTLETVKESIEFSKRKPLSKVNFYLALPYPKTELWDYVKTQGRFLKDDYTQFHHFSSQPIFETPEFSAAERAEAYALSRRLVVKAGIREEIRSKLDRLRRWDFDDLTLRRVVKATERLTKYLLDLILKRENRV
jgi:anaerobic magnesium-protoporphyrin IX monomethyl ester cyclase